MPDETEQVIHTENLNVPMADMRAYVLMIKGIINVRERPMRLELFLTLLLALQVAEGVDQPLKNVSANEILANISKGLPVEYDHITVKGIFRLDTLNLTIKHMDRTDFEIKHYGASENVKVITSPIRINDSILNDAVIFNNTILENTIDFSGSKFCSPAHFRYSKFDSSADFSRSNFNHPADFYNTYFNSSADFSYSNFNSSANFGESIFNYVSFIYSRIDSSADFGLSNFNHPAEFYHTYFNSFADFYGTDFNSHANFMSSTFESYADFTRSTFNSDTYFKDSRFNSYADFSYSTFNSYTDFSYSTFNKDLDFIGVSFDKLELDWFSIKDHVKSDRSGYITLIRCFKDIDDFEAADDCYYQYRNWRLFSRDQSWTKNLMDSLFLISCGYGVKPLYTILLSCILIVIFGLIYWRKRIVKKKGSQNISIKDAIFYSASIFFTLHPTLSWSYNERWRYLVIFEDILGWVFMTLFVVTMGHVMLR